VDDARRGGDGGRTSLIIVLSSYDDAAEQNCEKHLTMAASIDPTDPEVYQVRLAFRVGLLLRLD
jgi:hypothetical protein